MTKVRICEVGGCGKETHYRHRYCRSHYARHRRHGDPLAGRINRGEALRYLREVVLDHHGDECLIWPYGTNARGYAKIRIDGKHQAVHRYVCGEVHGAPPTPDHESAHSCGKGHLGCVNQDHLVWKTPTQNQADRLVHDTHVRGERSPNAKITETQAREILRLKGIKKQTELAEQFGISQAAVGWIHTGRNWGWLQEGAHQ